MISLNVINLYTSIKKLESLNILKDKLIFIYFYIYIFLDNK